jgi:hypothetical protein
MNGVKTQISGKSGWTACCPASLLTRTFRIATRIRVLLMGTLAILAIAAGWRLASNILPKDAIANQKSLAADVKQFTTWPWERSRETAYWYTHKPMDGLWQRWGLPPEDLIHSLPPRLGLPIVRVATSQTEGWVTLYYLVGFLWTLVCSSFFGIAIARMAALQYTRDDRLGLEDAIAFAQQRYGAHLGAIGLSVMFAVVCTTPMLVLSFLMWGGPIGIALAGIFWWVSMLCIGFGAVALVLTAIGYPLFWGAVATDGSDAYDTVSRALAYLKQRPLEYLGYTLFTILLGTIGWVGIVAVSESAIQIGRWAASCTGGTENVRTVDEILKGAATDSNLLWFGAQMIGLCDKTIRSVASGYSFAFVVCGFVAIYLLLRQSADEVGLDEIERPLSPVATLSMAEARRPPDESGESVPPALHDDQAHP